MRQIKAAQKAAEEKPKPPPKKQAEPRKPRKVAQEVDPEIALSIKAEAAAIAAAAFADAAAAAPQPQPQPSEPGAKRLPGSGTKRKAAAAKPPGEPKAPKPPREPKQQKQAKPRKASVPHMDPEAALSIKAEAAAIAAAVFAEAANKSQPAEPISAEEPPPKVPSFCTSACLSHAVFTRVVLMCRIPAALKATLACSGCNIFTCFWRMTQAHKIGGF